MLKKTTNYVIHEHLAKRAGKHYDLRIQYLDKEPLISFALPKARFPESKEKMLAIRTPDHPAKWLRINRMVLKGSGDIYDDPTYGEGTIRSVQKGRAEILKWDDNHIIFKIDGPIASGKYTLIKFKSKRSKKLDTWLLIKNKED